MMLLSGTSPTLQVFQGSDSIDDSSPMATLTACRLVDPTCATPSSILGDATEHLYQLNHVYVELPSKADTSKTNAGRLFARLHVWGLLSENHFGIS